MRTILALLTLAWLALPGFGATNQPVIQMLATTNGVVKTPTNLTSFKFQGVTITNLTGFGLAVSNAQLSVDTTQLPSGGGGGGSGTVTSVGLTMPSSIFDVASSPVTTSGTIGVTFDNQSANTVFAGPTTGGSAAPTMRALVDADIPSAIARDSEVASGYQPLDATLTAVAGASTGADVLVYFSAADTAAVTTFTSWGRGLVDDADQTAARITLGLVPGTDVQAYDADLAAVAGLGSTGMIVRTGAGTVAARTITGDSEITVSNGDGVSGNPTLAIASSITRDTELANYQPLDTDLTRLAGIGAGTQGDILYRDATGWTNLARGSDGQFLAATAASLAWSNAPSGGGGGDVTAAGDNTFTGINTFDGPLLVGGISRTNWFLSGDRSYAVWYSEFAAPQGESATRFAYPYFGGAIGSGATAVVGSDSGGANVQGYVRVPASSTAGSGYYFLLSITSLQMTNDCVFEWQFRPLATNNTVIIERWGWLDSASGTPTDGLYCERDGMVLTLKARNNSSEVASVDTFSIASNAWYYGQIRTALVGSDSVSTMRIWDSSVPPALLSTIKITNGLPTGSGRDTGAGMRSASTNNVAVNLSDVSAILTIMPTAR